MSTSQSVPQRVLLVDDDERVLLALAESLTPLGHPVDRAASVAEALQRAREQAYAVVLLDVSLPDGTGFDLAATLRDEGRLADSRVVFLTGLEPDDELLGRALALGCADFLTKPVRPELLRAKVRVLLDFAATSERLRSREADLRQTATMLVEALRRLSAANLRRRNGAEAGATSGDSVSDVALAATEGAVEALRQSEERYRLAARASNDVLWDWEVSSPVMYWSDSLCTVLGHGLPAEGGFIETSTQWRMDQVHPDDRARVEESLTQALRAREETWSAEYRFRQGNGAWARVVDRGCVVRDAQGVAIRLVGAVQDVTLAREQEEAARARAEFQQQLVGIVSHDLRNPIGAIALGASVMLNRGDLSDAQKLSAQQIVRAAERASRMVRDLLDFTRARLGGGIPIQPRALRLELLAEQVVRETMTAHPGRNIELIEEGETQGCWDQDRIAQVLSNLLGNAIAYSPPTAPVTVKLDGAGTDIVLSVHNSGNPIPPDLLPDLFEPLRRGHETSNSARSIGFGLYIVQNIVRAHGGRIEVKSTAAEGTTFTVHLPRQPPAPANRGSGVFSIRALKAAQDAARRRAGG